MSVDLLHMDGLNIFKAMLLGTSAKAYVLATYVIIRYLSFLTRHCG